MRIISVRNAYKVIGSEPSPYTNKVYAYMRYKNIPFANVPGWFPIEKLSCIPSVQKYSSWYRCEDLSVEGCSRASEPMRSRSLSTNLNIRLSSETVKGTMQVYSELLPEKVGWPVVPVLVTPDDQWIQDSEDIIYHLEAKFPDKKSSKYIYSLVDNVTSRNQ